MLDEVVNLDDQRVLDLGEEPPFTTGRGEGVAVTRVEQALEHDPTVADVPVPCQVDPAEAAVCQTAEDLVLTRDEVTLGQLRGEGVLGATLSAEPVGPARPAVGTTPDAPTTGPTEPPMLGDLGIDH